MATVMTGQLDVRAVWQIKGVDALFCVAKLDVLAIGAAGVLNLQGVGWQFSGSVLQATIVGRTVTVVAYSNQTKQIAQVVFDLQTDAAIKTYYLSGEIHKIDVTRPDHMGALLRKIPICYWKAGMTGHVDLYLYGAAARPHGRAAPEDPDLLLEGRDDRPRGPVPVRRRVGRGSGPYSGFYRDRIAANGAAGG